MCVCVCHQCVICMFECMWCIYFTLIFLHLSVSMRQDKVDRHAAVMADETSVEDNDWLSSGRFP